LGAGAPNTGASTPQQAVNQAQHWPLWLAVAGQGAVGAGMAKRHDYPKPPATVGGFLRSHGTAHLTGAPSVLDHD
jgi:hypothetical protein